MAPAWPGGPERGEVNVDFRRSSERGPDKALSAQRALLPPITPPPAPPSQAAKGDLPLGERTRAGSSPAVPELPLALPPWLCICEMGPMSQVIPSAGQGQPTLVQMTGSASPLRVEGPALLREAAPLTGAEEQVGGRVRGRGRGSEGGRNPYWASHISGVNSAHPGTAQGLRGRFLLS